MTTLTCRNSVGHDDSSAFSRHLGRVTQTVVLGTFRPSGGTFPLRHFFLPRRAGNVPTKRRSIPITTLFHTCHFRSKASRLPIDNQSQHRGQPCIHPTARSSCHCFVLMLCSSAP